MKNQLIFSESKSQDKMFSQDKMLYGYAFQEQLGKGGFATVFRARHYSTNQDVAIKVINWQRMKERKFEQKVMREVEIHSKLCHPNVIKLLDHFSFDENIYLVLELCENDTVKRYLEENGRLSEREARDLLEQIVHGLLYLQSQNIIHRDIKPDNLLLTKDMQVKIADFGLAAQLIGIDDKHMTMCGTPNYISPEVATRSSHGLEADCWALGCILYALLVGKPPFDSSSAKNTITQVVMHNPKVPSNVSRPASELIHNLLQKDPLKRMKLGDVLQHPFMKMKNFGSRMRSISASSMKKSSGGIPDSRDSGMGTNSFSKDSKGTSSHMTYHSNRSRSVDTSARREHLPSYNKESQPAPINYLQDGLSIRSALPNKFGCPAQLYGSREDMRKDGNSRELFSKRETDSHFDLGSKNNRSEDQLKPIGLNKDCLNWCYEIKRAHLTEGRSASASRRSGERSGTPVAEKMDIAPLSTERLSANRYRAKSAVLSILENGEVCVEFIKNRRGEDRVMDVIRITNDGLRVVLYVTSEGGRGVPVKDTPPPLPSQGLDQIFSYESLPRKYWSKYSYAARFINFVRAMTPKITFYSPRARCVLMENEPDPDFEAKFYQGIKLTKSGSKFKFVDQNGKVTDMDMDQIEQAMDNHLWTHFKECHKYCLNVNSALSSLSLPFEHDARTTSGFPLTIGKLPAHADNRSLGQTAASLSSPTHGVLPSFNGSASLMSRYSSKNVVDSCNNDLTHLARVEIPNIGIAQQSANGGFQVQYFDGSELWIAGESDEAAIMWKARDGTPSKYSINDGDRLTPELRKRLSQIPDVGKLLAEACAKKRANGI